MNDPTDVTSFTGAIRAFGFDAVIAGIESMDAADLTAGNPGQPSQEQLGRRDPALLAVEVQDLDIAGPTGPVPGRSYRLPGSAPGAGLVWVHGGAYIFGDLGMPEAHWVGLALGARGIAVMSVDYRKCLHGVHFPAPSDDVLAGWSWASLHAAELGVTSARLHLGGASAGASLAAGVAKRLRDSGEPVPASIVLAYGAPHAELPAPSAELEGALARHPPVERFDGAAGDVIRRHLVGPAGSLTDPYAFPAEGDLRGMPPTYLLNSEFDGLRASGERFGLQLAAAGVVTRVDTEPGTEHGHLNDPQLPEARRSVDRIASWILSV